MRGWLAWVVLIGSLLPTGPERAIAQEGSSEDRVVLEVIPDHETVFVHQAIRLTIRMSIERQLLDRELIQLFRRELDLPVQLDALSLGEAHGVSTLPAIEESGPRFAFGEQLVSARTQPDRTIDGRAFAIFEIERAWVATGSGELVIPPSTLRFAYATEFRDDFFEGRTPVDRHDAEVTSSPLRITVRPLPEEDRPPSFTGAVGRFAIEATTPARSLEVGESFKLEIRITGNGNLTTFDPPRLDGLEGFHILGMIEDRGESVRRVIVDLAALDADVTEIPALPFPFFDPEPPAGYRVVATQPIALDVGGTTVLQEPDVIGDALRAVPGLDDIHGLMPLTNSAPRRSPSSTFIVWLALLGPWLMASGLVTWRWRRERERLDPGGARARRAARRFRRSLTKPDVDVAGELLEYLAAHLRCRPAAVVDVSLEQRLASRGAPAGAASRGARLVEALVAAGYGGSPVEDAAEQARRLVDELEPRLRGSVA